jgi:sulfatase-modifying factor enzyme 1
VSLGATLLSLCFPLSHPRELSTFVAAEQPAPAPAPILVSTAPDARAAFGVVVPSPSEAAVEPETLETQRAKLLARLERELELSPEQLERVRHVFAASTILGQGNPRISLHPIGRAECELARAAAPLRPGDALCGAPHMVALYEHGPAPAPPPPPVVEGLFTSETSFASETPLASETPSAEPTGAETSSAAPAGAEVSSAASSSEARASVEAPRVCIDQFEFPNIPCEYPVVHVSAREAAQLCEAVGKRLCDAHEWEGACAGALRSPEQEYAWGNERRAMRQRHNAARSRVWAYGAEKDHARCATSSYKTPGCPGGGFDSCGSNTFPAGAFPGCVSAFGAYDLHGNAAEHMSLPLQRSELTSAGGSGATEMKGSWFIFSHYEAHEDDCRWRAPDWHASRVMDARSHGNYHLGFRCCKSIPQEPVALESAP